MPAPKKSAPNCSSKANGSEAAAKQPEVFGIAARLMQQPTPACDCTRCGMDYCDCSDEEQGTVDATETEHFRS